MPRPATKRGSATLVDGVAYVGSQDGRLYAIDAATAAVSWKTEVVKKGIDPKECPAR